MTEAVIVATGRTPIGRAFKGTLTGVRPDDLVAGVIRGVLDKLPSLDPATLDDLIRGYDMQTGETLWSMKLPAGGQATPMTYRGKDGKQYVVIAAGGHGSLGTTPGDSVIAYRLD